MEDWNLRNHHSLNDESEIKNLSQRIGKLESKNQEFQDVDSSNNVQKFDKLLFPKMFSTDGKLYSHTLNKELYGKKAKLDSKEAGFSNQTLNYFSNFYSKEKISFVKNLNENYWNYEI